MLSHLPVSRVKDTGSMVTQASPLHLLRLVSQAGHPM